MKKPRPIDLLAIDMAAGKHWIQRVHEDNLNKKREAIRDKHRQRYIEQRNALRKGPRQRGS